MMSMALVFLFVLACALSFKPVDSFKPLINSQTKSISAIHMSDENKIGNAFSKTLDVLKRGSLPVLIGASLLLGSPFVSEAARSGSR